MTDVLIVGAGILGLAHAWAARRRGLSVAVVDADHRAVGASIRNFGFVTVTGQEAGACWHHARRSAEVWADLAPRAGIEVCHRGLLVAARLSESDDVIDAFLETEMGAACKRLTRAEAEALAPLGPEMRSFLHSPHELRVESRTAIAQLTDWLATQGVTFHWGTRVSAIYGERVETSAGEMRAAQVVLCPGDSFSGPYAARVAAHGPTRCKLHMLRLAPPAQPLRAAVMSDHGLARYRGYADLPEADPLKARLDKDFAAQRAAGMHLIVVQSPDGSLVVGDTHHYAPTPDPFFDDAVAQLVLDEFATVTGIAQPQVIDRWLGTYASAPDWLWRDAPERHVRQVIVTAGCGASTAFSIAEETFDTWSLSDD